MKCPLLTDKNYSAQFERITASGDCIQKECAWWDPSLAICAIRTIAGKLDDIDTSLGHIDRKIPLGGAKW